MQIAERITAHGCREFRTLDGKHYRDMPVKGWCVAVEAGFGWAWRRCSPKVAAVCEAAYSVCPHARADYFITEVGLARQCQDCGFQDFTI